MKRLQRVKKSLLNHSLGKYAEFNLSQCSDYIAWLSKFKKVSEQEISFLADFVTLCLNKMSIDEEQCFYDRYGQQITEIEMYK